MKNILNVIYKYAITYIILIFIFIVGLILSALIPQKCIKANVIKSLETLEKENLSQEVGIIKKTVLDDFTDALMINVAYSIDTNHPIKAIMTNNFGSDKNKQTKEPIINTVEKLRQSLESENLSYYGYSRYWHGYLIYLRPLLALLDYTKIRILFTIILNLLALRLGYLLYKKLGKVTSIIFFISLYIISYYYCGLSLTYFPVLCISMISSIYIIKKENVNYLSFFIIGGLTSFFDLLTTPLLTLGIPILMYLMINKKEISFKKMIILCINWGLGYGLIWLSKWVIASIILDKNIMENALDAIAKRSGTYDGAGEKITLFDTIVCNIFNISYEIFALIFVTIVALILKKKENINISKREILQYLFIAVLPIVWYILTRNHSAIHPKFTYRNMFLTIVSLLILDYKILTKSIETKENVKNKVNKI